MTPPFQRLVSLSRRMRDVVPALLLLLVSGCAAPAAPPPTVDEEAVQFLVALDACIPAWFFTPAPVGEPALGDTITRVHLGDLASREMAPYRCVLEAGSDCARVRACYGLRSDATSGPCMGTPPRCEGDTLLVCVPAFGTRPTQFGAVDCTREGLSCLELVRDGVPTAQCARALCDSSEPNHCEGELFVTCQNGFELVTPPPLGSACRDLGGGVLQFSGAGEACSRSECRGEVSVSCDIEVGRLRRVFDCGLLGQTCVVSPTAPCVDADRHCSGLAICEGDLLQYCGTDGELHEYDCVAHGFAECENTSLLPGSPLVGGCEPVGARF